VRQKNAAGLPRLSGPASYQAYRIALSNLGKTLPVIAGSLMGY
jgi:hypothetical protein